MRKGIPLTAEHISSLRRAGIVQEAKPPGRESRSCRAPARRVPVRHSIQFPASADSTIAATSAFHDCIHLIVISPLVALPAARTGRAGMDGVWEDRLFYAI